MGPDIAASGDPLQNSRLFHAVLTSPNRWIEHSIASKSFVRLQVRSRASCEPATSSVFQVRWGPARRLLSKPLQPNAWEPIPSAARHSRSGTATGAHRPSTISTFIVSRIRASSRNWDWTTRSTARRSFWSNGGAMLPPCFRRSTSRSKSKARARSRAASPFDAQAARDRPWARRCARRFFRGAPSRCARTGHGGNLRADRPRTGSVRSFRGSGASATFRRDRSTASAWASAPAVSPAPASPSASQSRWHKGGSCRSWA